MPLPPSLLESREVQQRLTLAATLGARRAWAGMGRDFTASWRTVGARLVLLVSAAQLASARSSAELFAASVAEMGLPTETAGEVRAEALAGLASDGRSLDGLLYSSVTTAKTAAGSGAAPDVALQRGGAALEMYVQTLVADAARAAAAVSLTAHTGISGYVRVANAPCCSRCAVLAGRFYRYSRGFQRHPRCDCGMQAAEAPAGDIPSPQDLFRRGQITDLSKGETAALKQGADFSQVVNARRGTSGLKGLTTTEGTSRGQAAVRLRGRQRLTPDGILRIAGDDRELALSLLEANGYLVRR
jgi:hypothetical protein